MKKEENWLWKLLLVLFAVFLAIHIEPTGFVTGEKIFFSDDFSSSNLQSDWQPTKLALGAYESAPGTIHTPPPNNPLYSLVLNRGQLRLTVPGNAPYDFWYNVENAPQLTIGAPKGDFAIETKATLLSGPGNFHTGLIIYFGSSDAFIWGFAESANRLYWGKVGPGGGPVSYADPTSVFTPSIFLRIEKKGNTYSFLYKSPQDTQWITAGSMDNGGTPQKIGFITKTWGNGATVTTDFDYFAVTVLQPPPPSPTQTPPPTQSTPAGAEDVYGSKPADWVPLTTSCSAMKAEIAALDRFWDGWMQAPDVLPGYPAEEKFIPQKLSSAVAWPFVGSTYCLLKTSRYSNTEKFDFYLGGESWCMRVAHGEGNEVCCPKKFSETNYDDAWAAKQCCVVHGKQTQPLPCAPPMPVAPQLQTMQQASAEKKVTATEIISQKPVPQSFPKPAQKEEFPVKQISGAREIPQKVPIQTPRKEETELGEEIDIPEVPVAPEQEKPAEKQREKQVSPEKTWTDSLLHTIKKLFYAVFGAS